MQATEAIAAMNRFASGNESSRLLIALAKLPQPGIASVVLLRYG
jgi:hypothetical protein